MPRSPLAEFLFHMRRDHAIRRCAERFHVQLDHNEYAYLNRVIAKQKSKRTRVATLPARRAAYKIPYKGKDLIAVYSHHHHQIITFLTREQIATNNQ